MLLVAHQPSRLTGWPCYEDTIYLDEARSTPLDILGLTSRARQLKRSGTLKEDALEDLARYCGADASNLPHAVLAFESQRVDRLLAFLPATLATGELTDASPMQRFVCQWLEAGPICEAHGLWVSGPPGMGKTTMAKLLFARYGDQVYDAAVRGATDSYDRTSLCQYHDSQHRILLLNDVKPSACKRLRTGDAGYFWPDKFVKLLREVTDGAPLRWNFGNKVFGCTAVAKVVVNSTLPLPQDPEVRRRYSHVLIDEGNLLAMVHWNRVGTASDRCIVPRNGLAPAAAVPVYPKQGSDTTAFRLGWIACWATFCKI
jgi:hypothetical protein